MLQTTVNYLSMLETKRHNLVAEKQNDFQLGLNARDTAVREGQLAETQRHNLVTESQTWTSIFETQRHNQATESISLFDVQTRRMQIPISQQQADAATYNAQTNRYAAEQQAGIGWANVAINQQNADIYDRKVTNDFLNATNQWGVNTSNAATNQYNAETNRKSYDWNVTYGSSNLEIQQQEADTHRLDVFWKNINSAIHNAIEGTNSVTNIFKVIPGL